MNINVKLGFDSCQSHTGDTLMTDSSKNSDFFLVTLTEFLVHDNKIYIFIMMIKKKSTSFDESILLNMLKEETDFIEPRYSSETIQSQMNL